MRRLGLLSASIPPSGVQTQDPSGKPIWIHALSVGEVLSALPLVKVMGSVFQDRQIFFSVSTLTGFEVAQRHLKNKVHRLFYYPYDFSFSVKRIVNAVNPEFVVIVESDIWPNFLKEMSRRAVPAFLVNARLSDRSFYGYRRFGKVIQQMFDRFSFICAQSDSDARRFQLLGVPKNKIKVTGSMKFDQDQLDLEDPDPRLSSVVPLFTHKRPVVVAGSTHTGEEIMLVAAFIKIKNAFPDAVLVIAPRNPDRAGNVIDICLEQGLAASRMTQNRPLEDLKALDVMVVDTIGVLGHLYRFADAAFVGGSLVSRGGHNPLEPASFSKPVFFGPDMGDFKEVADLLIEGGGAVRIENAEAISTCISDIVGDPVKQEEMGERAFAVFSANKGSVEKTVSTITRHVQTRCPDVLTQPHADREEKSGAIRQV